MDIIVNIYIYEKIIVGFTKKIVSFLTNENISSIIEGLSFEFIILIVFHQISQLYF